MHRDSRLTRRGFLASTSCLGAAALFARFLPAPATAQEIATDARVGREPIADKGFASVRRVGPGVYATISDPSKGLATLSNGGFVVGSEGALLIEGFRSPAGASFQLDALRAVSRVPVRAAIDTHYHFDHTLGNAFYGARGIPVMAHPDTASLMARNYGDMQRRDKDAELALGEKRVRETPDDERRKRAKSDLDAVKLILDSVESAVIALPNRPLEPAKLPLTVDLGGIKAVVESRPGHTPTDLIVRVPDRNVVFTGDLLFNGRYPATFDADLGAWRGALEAFSGFDKETLFVPGHGPLCGPEGVATLRAVFDDLAEQAGRMYREGIPVEEAQHRYAVPARFKDFPIFSWTFCIGAAIAKFYGEMKAGRT